MRRDRIEGCGTVEVRISLKDGLISDLHFYGDYFSTLPPENLAQKFLGCPMAEAALRCALEGCTVSDYITGLDNEKLLALLCDF